MTDLSTLSDDQLKQLYAKTLVSGAAQKYGVPEDLAQNVAGAESGYRQSATSPKGAGGVMQLMPQTAATLGVDPTDTAQNIDGGVRYLKQQLDNNNGDPRLAAAAYNAGPGAVKKFGGVPPYAETQAYVTKVAGPDPALAKMSDADLIAAYNGGAPAKPAFTSDAPIHLTKNQLRRQVAEVATPGAANATKAASAVSNVVDTTLNTLGDIGRKNRNLFPFLALLPHADDVRAQGQGASLGLADEATGALTGAAVGIANKMAPGRLGFTAGDAYHAATDNQRTKQDQFAADHPVANFVDQAAGGLVNPLTYAGGDFIGAGPGGKGLLATMGRSGAVGAATGAVTGYNTADGGIMDRLPAAGSGAAVGGAVGAAAPAVGAVVGSTVRGLGGAASEAVDATKRAFTGATTDDQSQIISAAQQLNAQKAALAYVRRMGATPEGLQAADAAAAGKPITSAEAIGPNAIGQVSGLARRAGATPGRADAILTQRMNDRADRILTDVGGLTGIDPAAAKGDMDAMVTAGRAKAAPLYDKALSNPDPVSTPELDAIAKRPVVQSAMKSVFQSELNAGRDPAALGMTVGPDGESVQIKAPTAQTWDQVKKAVGDQIERNPLTGRPLPDSQSRGNFNVGVANKDLTTALKDAIPGYGDALNASGDYLSVSNAFDRAKGSLFKSTQTPAQFDQFYSGLKSDGEKSAVQSRLAADIYDKAQNGQLRPSLFKTPAVQAKLTTAFGSDKAGEITRRLEMEGKMAAAESRMRPNLNSVTGDVMAQGEAMDGTMGDAALKAGAHLMTGRPGRAAASLLTPLQILMRGAKTGVNQPTRDEIGRLLLEVSPSDLAGYLQTAPKPQPGSMIPLLSQVGGRFTAPYSESQQQ